MVIHHLHKGEFQAAFFDVGGITGAGKHHGTCQGQSRADDFHAPSHEVPPVLLDRSWKTQALADMSRMMRLKLRDASTQS
jgi:hypothetical protein